MELLNVIQMYKTLYKRDLQSLRDRGYSVYCDCSTSWLKLHLLSHLEQSILKSRGASGRNYKKCLESAQRYGCFKDSRI